MKVYVASVYDGRESQARFELEKQGFKVSIPMRRVLRVGGEISEPKFPGYLFVRLDLAEPGWESVNYTRGVIKMLPTYSLRPLAVPDDIVEDLEYEDVIDERPRPLAPGDRVEVADDRVPEGAQGVVDRRERNGRVKIWLDYLGGKLVDIPVGAARLVKS